MLASVYRRFGVDGIAIMATYGGMTLAEYKTLHGLTYQHLADLLDVHGRAAARTVQRYAEGERFPDPKMLLKISEVTAGEVTPDDCVRAYIANNSTPEKAA